MKAERNAVPAVLACFNGATTFQPWKSYLTILKNLQLQLLQWGHDFSAVEIDPCDLFAVMEVELQWGHDFSAVEMI